MKEENQAVIKALNKYGRVPQQWELLNKIDELEDRIEKTTELVKSLIIFWKKYSPDNTMEIGQFENILSVLGGDEE